MKSDIQVDAGEPATQAPQPPTEAAPVKAPLRLPTALKGGSAKNLRAEYRMGQKLRVDESASLSAKYPHLKSLRASLVFVDPNGIAKTTEVKYSANPDHAKSVLLFACPTHECVGGDFDLTSKLAEAVAKRRTAVDGQMFCLGNHKMPDGKSAACRSVLRFTLTLGYFKRGAAARKGS